MAGRCIWVATATRTSSLLLGLYVAVVHIFDKACLSSTVVLAVSQLELKDNLG